MGGIREVRRLRRICEGSRGPDGKHGPGEFAPEHVAAEGQSDLRHKEVRETARRKKRQFGCIRQGDAEVIGCVYPLKDRGHPLIQMSQRRCARTEGLRAMANERADFHSLKWAPDERSEFRGG